MRRETWQADAVAVIDLQGFVADLKDHVAEHGDHHISDASQTVHRTGLTPGLFSDDAHGDHGAHDDHGETADPAGDHATDPHANDH